MIGKMRIAQAMLLASTTSILAQGGNAPSAAQNASPPQVLSQTGTMYDGNNTNLQLPIEPNRYWVDLWDATISAGAR